MRQGWRASQRNASLRRRNARQGYLPEFRLVLFKNRKRPRRRKTESRKSQRQSSKTRSWKRLTRFVFTSTWRKATTKSRALSFRLSWASSRITACLGRNETSSCAEKDSRSALVRTHQEMHGGADSCRGPRGGSSNGRLSQQQCYSSIRNTNLL